MGEDRDRHGVTRASSVTSQDSTWSTPDMRAILDLVTDEMLDASASARRPLPSKKAGGNKENISPGTHTPRPVSGPAATRRKQGTRALRDTQPRNDTPRPHHRTQEQAILRHQATAANAEDARATTNRTEEHEHVTQAPRRSNTPANLGKRTMSDRSPQSAATARAAKKPAKKQRAEEEKTHKARPTSDVFTATPKLARVIEEILSKNYAQENPESKASDDEGKQRRP